MGTKISQFSITISASYLKTLIQSYLRAIAGKMISREFTLGFTSINRIEDLVENFFSLDQGKTYPGPPLQRVA